MAIQDKRISDEMIQTKGVVAAPDRLTGSAEENKQVFDRLIREAVAPTFNGLVDELDDQLDPENQDGRLWAAVSAALLAAQSAGDFDGVGIQSVEQTTTSTEDGGTNVFAVYLTDGSSYSVSVRNGSQGSKGDQGVSVQSVEQTAESEADNGVNTVKVTLSNGQSSSFIVRNGSKGNKGDQGVGIERVEQTTVSTEDQGENVFTVYLTDGSSYSVSVRNGSQGSKGDQGVSGVHYGSDEPGEEDTVWIDPSGAEGGYLRYMIVDDSPETYEEGVLYIVPFT